MISDKYKQFLINQKSRQSYRSYYQNYTTEYNKKNRDKLRTYQNNKNKYDKLMCNKGPLIEYLDKHTTISWD